MITKIKRVLLPLALVCLAPTWLQAQPLPGNHPAYLHALTDLRAARWLIYHQAGDPAVSANEDVAVTEIDAAIGEIKRAAADDGKDIGDHPAVDIKDHGSRLLRSMELIRKAHDDILQEEDNPGVRELRHEAVVHIDRAYKAADKAHAAWLAQLHAK